MSPMAHASWMDQIDAALSSVSDLLFSWVLMWLLSFIEFSFVIFKCFLNQTCISSLKIYRKVFFTFSMSKLLEYKLYVILFHDFFKKFHILNVVVNSAVDRKSVV